jgi:hypothetical protein
VAVRARTRRSRGGAPLRFRGPPSQLAALSTVPAGGEVGVELAGSGPEPSAVAVQPLDPDASDRAWVKLALPGSTPPGEYAATMRVDGRDREVVLEVEPRARLRISPRRLVLGAVPGERVSATIVIANVGNVASPVRDVSALGLFDVDGAERAVGRTFRSRAKGEALVERLAEELREGYGGVVRVAVEEGSGAIPPGEAREVRVTFHLPAGLQPGRVYEGAWALEPVNYMVRVEVAGEPAGREGA